MNPRRALVVSLSVLAACGGKAIWDPNHHSNHHPSVGSTGTQGVGGAGGAGGSSSLSASSDASSSVSDASSSVSEASSSAASGMGGTGGEEPMGGTPVTTSFEETNLGAKVAGEAITFQVPANTLGFTVVVKANSPFGRMGVKELRSPTEQKVVENYRIPGTTWEFSWFGITAAAVPQSDVASAMPKVLPGTWSLTLGDPYTAGKSGDVSVWFRTSSDGAFHGGSIDVNVFRAPNAASEAYLSSVVSKAFANWGGITLGAITHYPLDAKFAVIGETNYLQVVQESKAAPNVPALNLFAIESFSKELEGVLGIAAGIPGLGVAPGSSHSGVVMITTSDLELDAEVVKHEAGHLSGLFHTTEIDGSATDPLGDTPTCASVEQQQLGCPDASFVMFPYATPTADQFSPMQQKVMQGSTLYRGAFDKLAKSLPKAAALPDTDEAVSAVDLAAGPWRRHLSSRAADLLAAHWCRDGGPRDHARVMGRVATRAELERVAVDPSTPAWMKARASQVARRLGSR